MKGTFCRMSVCTRGMPSKKKRAKMPAEAPKAAPMGPLRKKVLLEGVFAFVGLTMWERWGLVGVWMVVLAYILRRALGVYWPSLSLGML